MDKFEINEIAVVAISSRRPEFIGSDVTIVSALTFRPDRVENPICINANAHRIEFPDGIRMWASPEALRKKKPPKEEISWEELQELMNWSPEGVTVNG